MSIEAPANFLDIVQRARLECGVSGTGPTSVTGNTGIQQLLTAWTVEGWLHIQRLQQDWHFMRKSTSFVTVAGQHLYTPVQAGIAAGRFGFWKRDTIRSFETAAGQNAEIFLSYMPYDMWRNTYLFGGTRDTRSQPFVFALHPPDHGLELGPVPAAGYTITADYFETPISMTADADIPSLPSQFFMIIVYKVMMDYGLFDAATETYTRGAQKYAEMLSELQHARTDDTVWAGALA